MKRLMINIFVVLCLGGLTASFMKDRLETSIDAYLQENAFQGSVLVAKEGALRFSKGYGLANTEHRIPNKPDTVFRIGSITKSFTAVAILQLQEKGLLNVHDPIGDYLPDYPNGDIITIHHLLSHTSGIPDITDFGNLKEIQKETSHLKKTLAYFKDLPLEFAPGSDAKYSNSGFLVLGAVIEKVAGISYEDYLTAHVLQPLGLHHTYYEHNSKIIPNRASGYAENRHADYIDMNFPHASGALASTVEDLYRFFQSLKTDILLSRESLNSLFTVYGSNENNRLAYGYGFMVGPLNEGMEGSQSSIIGHFGVIEGFEAALIHYPDEDLTIVLLSNNEKTDLASFHKNLAAIVRSSWR